MILTDKEVTMKKFYTLAILLLISGGLKAQLIGNKLNVYLNYQQHLPAAENVLVAQGDFTAPSLLANMRTVRAFSAKGLYQVKSFLSLGFGTDLTTYANWSYQQYRHYTGAGIREYSIYPVLQLHSPFGRRGLFNRLKPNLQLSPVLGVARVSMEQPVFEVKTPQADVSSLMTFSDRIYGFKASAGIDYSLHRLFGITANYGYRQLWLSPQLYHDRQLSQHYLEAGIYVLLYKNKRYYY